VVRELVPGLRQKRCKLSCLSLQEAKLVVDAAYEGHGALLEYLFERPEGLPAHLAPFRICVRKRPLMSFEHKAGEFDSVATDAAIGGVVCHDGRLHRSGRRLTMTHHHFQFDRVWPAAASNDDVYASVQPLVKRAAFGLDSTVLCYGQTGTGKTHTMVGILERAAKELRRLDLEVVFFEIHGKNCYDLLSGRQAVHLRADGQDNVHVRGAKQVSLANLDLLELMELLQQALSLRRAEATERNPISSRSHAVCELRVKLSVGEAQEGEGGHRGVLRIVDLAGSERNYETHNMTAQMHRDSAQINTALMALKDCFRAYGINVRPPFRASRLTQVLRACFTDRQHKTLVIATVSPTPTDLIHTVNSLTHVSYMAECLSSRRRQITVDLPLVDVSATARKPISRWSHDEVVAWIGAVEGGRFAHVALPPGLDGAGLMKLSTMRLSQLFDGTLRQGRGENEGSAWTEALGGMGRSHEARDTVGRALFAALRKESRRIAEAEGRRRMGQRRPAEDGEERPSDPHSRAITTAQRVQTVGGPQVQWWLDDNSPEAADEAAAEAQQLLHPDLPAGGEEV